MQWSKSIGVIFSALDHEGQNHNYVKLIALILAHGLVYMRSISAIAPIYNYYSDRQNVTLSSPATYSKGTQDIYF